jgi:hypothetical protein
VNSRFSCLSLSSTGIISIYHHAQLNVHVFITVLEDVNPISKCQHGWVLVMDLFPELRREGRRKRGREGGREGKRGKLKI